MAEPSEHTWTCILFLRQKKYFYFIFLFQRARNQFRNLLGKSTQKLKASYDKLGKCVGKARPYYVLLTESKEVIFRCSLKTTARKLNDIILIYYFQNSKGVAYLYTPNR